MADAMEWTGREGFRKSDPEKVAAEMYRDVRAQAAKSRLTWTAEEMTVTPHTDEKTRHLLEDGKVGEFRPKLPYILVSKLYYIQNSKLYNRGGREITLDDIPPSKDKELVIEALGNFKESALNADPKLCRECAAFRAEGYEEMVKHLFNAHPEKFAALMKEVSPELPLEPEPEKKSPGGKFKCACGQSYAEQGDWLAHVKTHKAAATAG